jgi:integrase
VERVKRSVILGFVNEMTKSEAKRKLWNIIAESGANKPHYAAPAGTSFARVTAVWEETYLSRRKPSTRRTMRHHIRKYLLPKWGTSPVDTITAAKVNEWLGELRGLAANTMKHLVTTLCMILGRRFGRKQVIYPSQFDAEEEPICFTQEQMKAVVGRSKGKYQALFETAAETGMRAGELYALTVGDIDFTRCVIHVRRAAWEGKTQSPKSRNAYRVIDVQPSLIDHLRGYLGGRAAGLVFPSRNETALRNSNVLRRALYPILKALGIPKGGMHGFRHGRVSFLMEQGVPLEVIKRWIGHGSEAMIRRYTHLRPEYGQKILRQLPGVVQSVQGSWPLGPTNPEVKPAVNY